MRSFTALFSLAWYILMLFLLLILVVNASAAPSDIFRKTRTHGYLKITGADIRDHLGSVSRHISLDHPSVYTPSHPSPQIPSTQYTTSFGSMIPPEPAGYMGSISIPHHPTSDYWIAKANDFACLTIQQLHSYLSNVGGMLQEIDHGSGSPVSYEGEGPEIEQIISDILL